MTRPGQPAAETGGPSAHLDPAQIALLRRYQALLLEWNARVNLVSRRLGAGDVWSHIEHCLCICVRPFSHGAIVVDWGTGGGLPALPLAIACPYVHVVAVDSTLKKIRILEQIASELGLHNVTAVHARADSWGGNAEVSVSRATASLATLWSWHLGAATRAAARAATRMANVGTDESGFAWRDGLLALKGGDLRPELSELHGRYPGLFVDVLDLREKYGSEYEGKVLVHVR